MTILFTAGNYDAGFILTDLRLLRTIDSVEILPATRLPDVWGKLKRIPHVDIVYGWFADLPNLDTGVLCRLLRKRFVLAIAGYEVASLQDIGYGLQRRHLTRLVVRQCLRNASTILVLHRGLSYQTRTLYPEIGDKIEVVPPGFDASFWVPGDDGPRTLVTTVISSDILPRFQVKGGPMVLEVARRCPGLSFVAVGVVPRLQDLVIGQAPPNVRFVSRVSQEELRRIFQASSMYLQFSIQEVFPNAVCEAMLCGCVPVVSPLPVMREVVGDAGFVVSAANSNVYASALKEALEQTDTLRARARERIASLYPLEKRRSELQRVLRG